MDLAKLACERENFPNQSKLQMEVIPIQNPLFRNFSVVPVSANPSK